MRVLVCGDRNWTDASFIIFALSGLAFEYRQQPEFVVIEGEAKGADTHARIWTEIWEGKKKNAPHPNISCLPFPADWEKHHRAAGPIRNRQMLVEGKPNMVYAFHDDLENSKGTKDMVKQALKAGIAVYHFRRVPILQPKPLKPLDVKGVRKGLEQITSDVGKLFP